MNRRTVIGGLGGFVAAIPGVSSAQLWRTPRSLNGWRKVPSIVVLSVVDDVRLPAVYEAVAFWNSTLTNVGTPFRLGAVAHGTATLPHAEIRRAWAVGSYEALDRAAKMSGDIFVVLSDFADGSFAMKSHWAQKALVVIASEVGELAPHPNGLQNMIAHEFGHAIGLGHNNEAKSLMCGGNPGCGSKHVFDGFLPLTRSDKVKLLGMYPSDWREEAAPP